MSKIVNIIFPHQLFSESKLLQNDHETYLIEEHLFFNEFNFHKQKIAFHRASLKSYVSFLREKGKTVHYIDAQHELSDIRNFAKEIQDASITKIEVIDPTDDWLEQRILKIAEGIELEMHENPQFLNRRADLPPFFRSDKKSFFQTSFYKNQRKQRGILMDGYEPEGGKWTYDTENRKKYPKNMTPPPVRFPEKSDFWTEAVEYTSKHFSENPGEISPNRLYPINHEEADAWLEQFLTYRFFDFGSYEDAIVKEFSILNHSMVSPLINTGLILPDKVLQRSLEFAKEEDIPINSVEGFVRQIVGWREFIRGMYECKG
ncbi:MAG: cryptochrome/photolyase family protein, partial [Crocinitomicaceae bacterium]|nr:cryptochrome/photolyase family protein [Crocinitomicaceae bacterium]